MRHVLSNVSIALVSCLWLGASGQGGSPPKPAPSYSLKGAWVCVNASSKSYTEGLSFDDKGHFMRWGREEGGWSEVGTCKLDGNKLIFSSKEDSPWTYGVKEFAKQGTAILTWSSKDEFKLVGPRKTDHFKRYVPKNSKPGHGN